MNGNYPQNVQKPVEAGRKKELERVLILLLKTVDMIALLRMDEITAIIGDKLEKIGDEQVETDVVTCNDFPCPKVQKIQKVQNVY